MISYLETSSGKHQNVGSTEQGSSKTIYKKLSYDIKKVGYKV